MKLKTVQATAWALSVQVKSFIIFRRPVVSLWFCCHFTLLILKVRAREVDLDVWPENDARWTRPFEIIRSDDCNRENVNWLNDNHRLCCFSPFTVTLCSPDPAWVNKSTCTDTSPTTSSSTFVESRIRKRCDGLRNQFLCCKSSFNFRPYWRNKLWRIHRENASNIIKTSVMCLWASEYMWRFIIVCEINQKEIKR